MKTKVRVVEVEFERDGCLGRQRIETVPVCVEHSGYFDIDNNVPIPAFGPPEEIRGDTSRRYSYYRDNKRSIRERYD